MRSARILSVFLHLAILAVPVCCILLAPATGSAQAAGDIATARRTATEGIRLFQQGDFAGALERLERAQALYDAPVHRLYIARAQVKLGRWVEGAETYRKLARLTLDEGAAKEFRSAVASGKVELAELEPKIPTLRVVLNPEAAHGVRVFINEQELPRAAVGIERLSDPGAHKVEVRMEGAASKEQTITLRESAKEEVVFEFLKSAVAASNPAKVVAKSELKAEAANVVEANTTHSEKKPFQLEYLVGLRLGISVPGGSVAGPGSVLANELKMDQIADAGGGLELRGGVRFHPRLAAVAYLDASSLKGGSGGLPEGLTPPKGSASWTNLGLGMVLSTDPGEFGGFGEMELAYGWMQSALEFRDTCKFTLGLRGPGLRIGGGLNIPTKVIGTLTPVLLATLGQFGNYTASNSCPAILPANRFPLNADANGDHSESIDPSQQRGHYLIFLGIGSELSFGGGR